MNEIFIHKFGKLKLDKDGIIYHNDIPFVHEGTIKLFKQNIVIENNEYFVKIGENKAPIEVEDVYLWIENIGINESESKIILKLTNDLEIEIINDTNLYLENNNLYYINNQIKVKFTRKTYNQIMSYLSQPYENYLLKVGSLKLQIVQK